jgi:hypothetical protein
MHHSTTIRQECLRPADDDWEQPTGPEIREVIERAGFTGSKAGKYLGISVQETGGCRQIRKWIAEDARIPYSAWALLCHAAGFGTIWIDESEPHA